MGKPNLGYTRLSAINRPMQTPGSETSQYREENKLISISLVAASEKEEAQTRMHLTRRESHKLKIKNLK
ncbi:MAG: hypothetical protein COX02_01525 [Candidatus Vogelbacteria bacterium CG22_combo_CG10-13_8_21_14_all_37_9]|uniref:Uncharacterized protein n=1 Tax=Candidatus Vogelbacteria bacterium CG22_combo_CG10-13_8_21_14_all_37_9 TaxID=1975046 RepID=A0A2H0BKJ4_9BACT|nr:MAG: hypothetical protein BK005_00380 [bacterium CG10_37_50]PIP58197.1 MAG: hypothetical protein COX02_01525 [Candidatus Vogelbacteria bacterium CG22_combo_CG10-13_8_21_14_all_37_9]